MKKILSLTLAAVILVMCLSSCAEKKEDIGYFTRTMRDENGRLSVSLSKTDKEGNPIGEKELSRIYEETCDVFKEAYLFLYDKEQSDLAAVNASVDNVFDMDKTLIAEINKAFELSEATGGLYQPASGALTALLKDDPAPDAIALAEAISHTGTDKFELSKDSLKKLDREAKLDFASYRDGYALSAACEFLKESTVAYGTVTFNGIAGVFGQKPDGEPFSVEIGNGTDGIFNITDGYVALVCADFGTYYDFKDGDLDPALNRAAVYSPDAVCAAVVASVSYVHGSDAALKLYESPDLSFEAVLKEENGTEIFTKNVKDSELYTPVTTVSEAE